MANAEEQGDELEALESIFPETLKVLSPTRFTLSGSADGGTYDETDFVAGFVLDVTFPPEYPEVAPNVRLVDTTGILEDNDEILGELTSVVSETIEENLGMAMVFAIHAAVQERLEDILTKKRDTTESAASEAKQAEIDAEIARYTAGTLVTLETFEEWKTAFEAEMEPSRTAFRLSRQTTVDGKLTGRQLFEQKKMTLDSEKGLTDKTDVIIDTSVFEGLDLDDLDLPEDGADAAAPS
eukprot:m.443947 g.443947  ORF g.443947 m.443947 type:complete len:239 (+) comp19031_c0_seq1:42-758(+)